MAPGFGGENYSQCKAEVLLCNAITSLEERRRAGALILKLEGQPKQQLLQKAAFLLTVEENNDAGGKASSVKRFLGIL